MILGWERGVGPGGLSPPGSSHSRHTPPQPRPSTLADAVNTRAPELSPSMSCICPQDEGTYKSPPFL
eukprot:5944016-Prymnesium_polylepis.1